MTPPRATSRSSRSRRRRPRTRAPGVARTWSATRSATARTSSPTTRASGSPPTAWSSRRTTSGSTTGRSATRRSISMPKGALYDDPTLHEDRADRGARGVQDEEPRRLQGVHAAGRAVRRRRADRSVPRVAGAQGSSASARAVAAADGERTAQDRRRPPSPCSAWRCRRTATSAAARPARTRGGTRAISG